MIIAVICLHAAPWVQMLVRAGNGWPHYGTTIAPANLQLPLLRCAAAGHESD